MTIGLLQSQMQYFFNWKYIKSISLHVSLSRLYEGTFCTKQLTCYICRFFFQDFSNNACKMIITKPREEKIDVYDTLIVWICFLPCAMITITAQEPRPVILTHLDSNADLFSTKMPLHFENHCLNHCCQIHLCYPWCFVI